MADMAPSAETQVTAVDPNATVMADMSPSAETQVTAVDPNATIPAQMVGEGTVATVVAGEAPTVATQPADPNATIPAHMADPNATVVTAADPDATIPASGPQPTQGSGGYGSKTRMLLAQAGIRFPVPEAGAQS